VCDHTLVIRDHTILISRYIDRLGVPNVDVLVPLCWRQDIEEGAGSSETAADNLVVFIQALKAANPDMIITQVLFHARRCLMP
jgi:hypothetical protein